MATSRRRSGRKIGETVAVSGVLSSSLVPAATRASTLRLSGGRANTGPISTCCVDGEYSRNVCLPHVLSLEVSVSVYGTNPMGPGRSMGASVIFPSGHFGSARAAYAFNAAALVGAAEAQIGRRAAATAARN